MDKSSENDWIEFKIIVDGIKEEVLKMRKISNKERNNFSVTDDITSKYYPKILRRKIINDIDQIFDELSEKPDDNF